jgi:hypothetical protein
MRPVRPPPHDRETPWIELAASAELSQPCRGFDGSVIQPGEIVALLNAAARQGEPHSVARMLLFRDIAAPKAEVMGEIPRLLASHDPSVVRDVGAFLSKGEAVWRYGAEEVPAPAAAIAWELAACDLGYACGRCARAIGSGSESEAENPGRTRFFSARFLSALLRRG